VSLAPVLALLLIQLVGSEFTYTVRSGDSLTSIGARFGVDARVLAGGNGIEISSILRAGQALKIDNRHIVPEAAEREGAFITINVPQRMLFYSGTGQPVQAFPVAAGKPGWKTPLGDFTVTVKETDPVWDVPVSIQEEMRREGKPVLTHVPPSPQNPLGKYWLGLTLSGIGIHGTNAPSSIYSHATHGCVRAHPDDIEALFPEVETGTHGTIAYEPVLSAHQGDAVFLEVHPDVYKKGSDALSVALGQARAGGFLDLVDQARVREVIRKHDGIARDVTRR
jgi:L,D-transpeptidase ErfK/SrfK